MYKFVVLAAVVAVANAGLLAAPAVSYATPAITAQSSNILRTPGNLGQISTYTKSIDTPYSSVRKSDVRVSNDALAYGAAYAPALAAPLGVGAIGAPLGVRAIGAPLGVGAIGSPLGVRAIGAPLGVGAIGSPLLAPGIAGPLGVRAIGSPLLAPGIAAPLGVRTLASPLAAPAVAHGGLLGVAYSAAPAVSHVSVTGLGASYIL